LNNSLEEFLLSSCIVDDLLSDFSDSDSDWDVTEEELWIGVSFFSFSFVELI
jgi:hypothetical protein